jgi:glycosyltransferase involved in cell wall biosynthesis
MKPLRITFLLPGTGHLPTGGGKVVYEYANHLSRRGHRVSLVHPALSDEETRPLQGVKRAVSYVQRTAVGGFRPDKWFPLEGDVRTLWVPTLSSRFIPDGDVVLATAWATAEWVPEYPASKGEKFYLIQSWETWDGPEERVCATWKTPLKKIVVARWLRDIAGELGVQCAYIPNGIDFRRFGLDAPIESRNPNRLMMLYHSHPVKGSADGLEALTLVAKQLPDLRVTLFGTHPANADFPAWVDYRRLPSQQELRACYNSAAIFIAPARTEGWPLPPAEAMSCGAALAATDIGGHREYGVHEETALLSPPRAPEKLAENILRLVRDSELRTRLARQGRECIQKFGWDVAVDSFEQLLGANPVAGLQPRAGRLTVPSSQFPVLSSQ